MVIDAHQHFWNYDPHRHAWINDAMSVLKRNFLPADLDTILDSNNVDGTIAVQADTSTNETEFLMNVARSSEKVLGVVGWIDLTASDIEAQLQAYVGRPKLCGFRHIVQDEPDDRYLLRDDVVRGIRAVGTRGFTYDILIYPRQLLAAIELVARCPNQTFILDHCAKPFIKSRQFEPWAAQIRELAKSPRVFCKLSGLVTETDWRSWRPADFRPYLDLVVEAFGPSRLMFGSDWPVCLLAGEYHQVKELIAEYSQQFSDQERRMIFGGTAAKSYGIAERSE
ncbi:MAG TPA: amidohydrolase family protein [Candidatus Acidoferrum sp.]|nr:amidohydrolase family protein [Candidatus Acidoferrum sp.]